jgi:hypothetical protein
MNTIWHPVARFGSLLRNLLFIAGLLGYADALAQQAIDTQPLSVTSICAGAQIDVPGLRSSFSESVAVELSDGGNTYSEIPSVLLSASGRYEITYRATIPASTPAGTNYRIRLVAKNPSAAGTPSPTVLSIKAKPAPPTVAVASLSVCQGQVTASLSATKLDTSASLIWYGTNATGGTGTAVAPKPATDATGTVKYYVAQKVKDCESERAEIVVDVKPSSPASATFSGNQSIYQGQTASLSIAFSGYSPWEFSYRDSTAGSGAGTTQPVITSTSPYTFTVSPQKTTAYILTSISNVCGPGTMTNRLVVVTVTPLLATDDPALADAVEVYPVPATTTLTVHIKGVSAKESAWIELLDASGRRLGRQQAHQPTSWLQLDGFPPGTYLLHIRQGDRAATKRVVKY